MKNKGITLIALVITIIILMVLTATAVTYSLGSGLFEKTRTAKFAQEMQQVRESVWAKRMFYEMEQQINGPILEKNDETDSEEEKVASLNKIKSMPKGMGISGEDENEEIIEENPEEINQENLAEENTILKKPFIKATLEYCERFNFPDTLKKEILCARDNYLTDKESYSIDDFNRLIESSPEIYIVDKDTAGGKENTYVYDWEKDIVYKIPKTKINGKIYHSYECLINYKGPRDVIIKEASIIADVNGVRYYSPNLKGFNADSTYLVYYSPDYEKIYEMPVRQYIKENQPWQKKVDGEMFTLYDYKNKVWANVKTVANGIESWWVWIPRYAYVIDNKTVSIAYVDLENNILNDQDKELASKNGYTVHTDFSEKGEELYGIWMSKYEPSYVKGPVIQGNLAPDMEGFDKKHTYIELFDKTTNSFTKEVLLKEANLNTINSKNEWYDYSKDVWANIKTNANGIESWWVWVPRYAYKVPNLGATYHEVDIIFIGLDDKPINKDIYPTGLPEGYIVHPSFNIQKDGETKKLSGIWMSKYEPSFKNQTATQADVIPPDMEGFDQNNTYIELYDSKSGEYKEEVKLKDANLEKINKDHKWYDYQNKIWANVKTIANGIESWWVWIPRYAYKIPNAGASNKEVSIIFIGMDNEPVNKDVYPNGLPSGYTIHPAFTIKDGENVKELKGIWMSKYEPSFKNQTATPADPLAPDMEGFDANNTYIELYNSDGTFTDKKLSSANLETINKDKKWYDYPNKVWANIKTTGNGIESWWVWIPRYAYKIPNAGASNKEVDIIFVDLNDKPVNSSTYPNGLPSGYTVHPAFNVNGKKLKGIWMSKYEPSFKNQTATPADPLAPDMTGFDANNTYIELYNSDGTFTEKKLSGVDLNTINRNNSWYNYNNKIWANIKTAGNGIDAWWVWIPRYAYKIPNAGASYKEVDIIFIDLDNEPVNSSIYPNGLPEGYTVHPAFNVNGKNLSGIWMSKYEPSKK